MDDAPTDPPARDVIAHCCSSCTCSGVENVLQRNRSSSSEASVGTGSIQLVRAGSEQSGGSARSGARYRGDGPAASGAVSSGNGQHVKVNVLGSRRLRSLRSFGRQAAEEEEEEDEFCTSETVASNLLELNSGKYKKLKLAFDDWEKSFKTFQKKREYKEALRDAIRNEIYQVIGFYIVFQGVIITAVAQASVLHCRNWWTVFLLSLLTSLVTIGVVLQKLGDFWALEKTIADFKTSSKVIQTWISEVKLKSGPRDFDFSKNAKDGKSKDLVVPGSVKVYRFAVITVLLCFSTLFLVTIWRILCRS